MKYNLSKSKIPDYMKISKSPHLEHLRQSSLYNIIEKNDIEEAYRILCKVNGKPFYKIDIDYHEIIKNMFENNKIPKTEYVKYKMFYMK